MTRGSQSPSIPRVARGRGTASSPRGRCRAITLASSTLLAAAWLSAVAPAQVEEAAFFGLDINSNLGWAVALSGDTAAVAGPGRHDNSLGHVWVYQRSAGTWSETQLLVGSTVDKPDWFGYAVAIDGDVIAAGDWGESDGVAGAPGYQRGAAYVFRRPDGSSPFVEQQRIQPVDLAEHDRFGMAVALAGDLLAVAARGADDAGSESGAVYVFRETGDVWTQEARLTAPAGAADDRFGFSLALSGDTLAVGADGSDVAAGDAGAVYVYVYDGGGWTLQATLASASAARDDRFGTAVALQGDQLAVGVPRRDVSGQPNAGVVEVWQRSAGVWSLDDVLADPAPVGFDNLGTSVALDDGRVLAGEPHDDAAGAQAGTALLFGRVAGRWSLVSELGGSLVDASDQFGHGVALDGELTVVGAPGARESGTLALGLITCFSSTPEVGP